MAADRSYAPCGGLGGLSLWFPQAGAWGYRLLPSKAGRSERGHAAPGPAGMTRAAATEPTYLTKIGTGAEATPLVTTTNWLRPVSWLADTWKRAVTGKGFAIAMLLKS